ncbi:MAG: 4-hydroxy-3-methylbut-2-enyl diphosphate reductase [Bifidobacteriaceae bacterium]|nr:4-hydroxy-3-methylbut-2-enyl diphosphate reductase [Bifidobacteriaceae bacterium]
MFAGSATTAPSDAAPGRREILVAAPRGYCAGVDRAVACVVKALEIFGAPVYVRGQIVHNTHVVARLAEMGAVFVQDLSEVPRGSRIVFSAHGVSPQVRQQAAERDLSTIDATCPLVTKVHKEAVRFAQEGYGIVLIGHAGHEEVEGTAGQAPDQIRVVGSARDVDQLTENDAQKLVWLSQTTLSVDETAQTVNHLRARFPDLVDPPSDDICYATQNRQSAVKLIAPRCDVVIVVGSGNSSNSVRLVEVARGAGAGAAYLVDGAGQIDPVWLADAQTVGLTSGASVPEDLVDDAVTHLMELGFTGVTEVTAATETLAFALPRDLRAAGRGTSSSVDL